MAGILFAALYTLPCLLAVETRRFSVTTKVDDSIEDRSAHLKSATVTTILLFSERRHGVESYGFRAQATNFQFSVKFRHALRPMSTRLRMLRPGTPPEVAGALG